MTLQKSETKAENLLDAQNFQYETITAHSQVHDNLQTNMHISKALVDEATAAAANLQTMINESASKYRDSFFSGGSIGPYSPWTICVLLFCMLSAQNLKYALTLLFIGICMVPDICRVERLLTPSSSPHCDKDILLAILPAFHFDMCVRSVIIISAFF